MVRGSHGTRFTSSTLIRLLAQLAEADVPESRQAFAEGLSQWLSWTDAISLAAALDGRPASTPEATSRPALAASAAAAEFTRVRSALAKSIAEDSRRALADPQTDFSPLRRRYAGRQEAMEASISALRSRLREALANSSPSMVRLAAVDAVMDQVLAVKERALLATVPLWLQKHFERMREFRTEGWWDVFCKDMSAVLLAELDVRLQPAEGLLDALRMRQPSRNE